MPRPEPASPGKIFASEWNVEFNVTFAVILVGAISIVIIAAI